MSQTSGPATLKQDMQNYKLDSSYSNQKSADQKGALKSGHNKLAIKQRNNKAAAIKRQFERANNLPKGSANNNKMDMSKAGSITPEKMTNIGQVKSGKNSLTNQRSFIKKCLVSPKSGLTNADGLGLFGAALSLGNDAMRYQDAGSNHEQVKILSSALKTVSEVGLMAAEAGGSKTAFVLNRVNVGVSAVIGAKKYAEAFNAGLETEETYYEINKQEYDRSMENLNDLDSAEDAYNSLEDARKNMMKMIRRERDDD